MPGFRINLAPSIAANQWVTLEEVFVSAGPWSRVLTTDQTIDLKQTTSTDPVSSTQTLIAGSYVISLPQGYNKVEVHSQVNANITWRR